MQPGVRALLRHRTLARVFAKLYELKFPIRHLELSDMYGPRSGRPTDGDISGSFECRQASASPAATRQAGRPRTISMACAWPMADDQAGMTCGS